MNLGTKIRKIREIKNYSQTYMASQLGITQAAYSALENGKTEIDEVKLNSISEILKVDPNVIKNFSEEIIFNSCIQSGVSNNYNINQIDKIQELYERIIAQKDDYIKELEDRLKGKI